jgi:hydroxymethylbilane synthase
LLHTRSDLVIEEIRGNVETRLRKLDDGEYEAIVLAEAGLKRLGFVDRITQVLPRELMLPAIGQGALGIEACSDDETTLALLAPLNDPATRHAVLAERSLLRTLRGGCLAPVGAWGRIEGSQLKLDAVVLSGDGQQRLLASGSDVPEADEAIGEKVAQQLLDQGAAELISNARQLGGDIV